MKVRFWNISQKTKTNFISINYDLRSNEFKAQVKQALFNHFFIFFIKRLTMRKRRFKKKSLTSTSIFLSYQMHVKELFIIETCCFFHLKFVFWKDGDEHVLFAL